MTDSVWQSSAVGSGLTAYGTVHVGPTLRFDFSDTSSESGLTGLFRSVTPAAAVAYLPQFEDTL